jgi:general secretion pathway protein D
MKNSISHWQKYLAAGALFALCALVQLHAQPSPFGFGNSGGNRGSRSSSSSSSQYPRNGDVGDAIISIDPETRNLVVIADDDTLQYLSQVVSNLDRPQPQVLIKVVFVEVSRDTGLDFGVDGSFNKPIGNSWNSGIATNYTVFPSIGNAGGSNGTPSIVPSVLSPIFTPSAITGTNISGITGLAGGTGLYQIMAQDFTVTLHAIATAGKAKILSRPSIVARNNQPASITVGQRVPLITSVRYDTFGNAINGITYTDVGIILRVTPYITSDGLVQMILSPETSAVSPTGGTTISSGPGGLNPVVAPYIDQRTADTVVVTPSGQTVIIGGLIYDQKAEAESKVPFIGDIPILGNFFKRKVKTEDKKELLIFLTPQVIAAPTEFAALSNKEKARSDAVKGMNEQELDKFLDQLPQKPKTDWKKAAGTNTYRIPD